MTEAEWLTATDRVAVLAFLRDRVSERKLRLYLCAGCRAVWWLLVLKESRHAVEVAERYADGEATADELGAAAYHAEADCLPAVPGGPPFVAAWLANFAANDLPFRPDSEGPHGFSRWCFRMITWMAEVRWPGSWLTHDIFGNPFRPVTVDPAWLTSDVFALAAGIYADRAFDRLPILADALQDAGCDNADILNHCRSDGPHVRGCFVVDLLLGKE